MKDMDSKRGTIESIIQPETVWFGKREMSLL
jgi:hypothetical protein